MKDYFASQGNLLIESEVNGRLISTFELLDPILFDDYQIKLIELPAPKPGKVVRTGFEHFEVVCDIPFDEIVKKNAQLLWDKSGLQKLFNQELEIKLESGAVKFHHLSLLSVINLEKNKTVWSALQETKILSIFKDLNPLVAGTFPLALETNTSDLDILLCCKDLVLLRDKIKSRFESHSGFKVEQTVIDGLPTLICNFIFSGLPFEIFAQDLSSVKQKAYLHFLAEEKLLKFGGHQLLKKVKTLKEQGLKTELAMAEALRLSGDPFEEILTIQFKSLSKLPLLFNK